MKFLTKEESMLVLGGTQNLAANNTNTIVIPVATVMPQGIVNFTGNDLEE